MGVMQLPDYKYWNFILTDTGCWEWPTVNKRLGYGIISVGHDTQLYAHRVFYDAFKGNLVAGMTIDHLCRNRRCVNPNHLEQVTSAENKRRGDSPAALNSRKSVCPQGHYYTLKKNGKRYCKTCFNAWQRDSWKTRHAS